MDGREILFRDLRLGDYPSPSICSDTPRHSRQNLATTLLSIPILMYEPFVYPILYS